MVNNKNKEISVIKKDMDEKVTELSEENKKCLQEIEKIQDIINNNDQIASYFYNQVKGTNETLDEKFELKLFLMGDKDRKLMKIFKYVRLPQLKGISIISPQCIDYEDLKQFMVSIFNCLCIIYD